MKLIRDWGAQDPELDQLIRAAAATPVVAPPVTEKWASAVCAAAGSASLLAALQLTSAASPSPPPLQLSAGMQEDTQVCARSHLELERGKVEPIASLLRLPSPMSICCLIQGPRSS